VLHSLPSVSVELVLDGHWVFAQRTAQFPSGFDSNLLLAEAKVGANYHFDPARFGKGGKNAAGRRRPGRP